jgi:small basic protein
MIDLIPSQPVSAFQYTDLIVLPLLAAIIFRLLHKARGLSGSLGKTISETLALDKQLYTSFSIVMSILYPLYYAFLWLWLGPHVQMPKVFYVTLAVAVIFEMIFVWVPARGRKQLATHVFAAGVVGACMLASSVILLLTGVGIGSIATAMLWIFIVSSFVMACLLLIPRHRKYIFSFEIAYITLFLIAFSFAAHS